MACSWVVRQVQLYRVASELGESSSACVRATMTTTVWLGAVWQGGEGEGGISLATWTVDPQNCLVRTTDLVQNLQHLLYYQFVSPIHYY
jgi:hypothetical protein